MESNKKKNNRGEGKNNESRRARVKTRFSSVLYPGGKKIAIKLNFFFISREEKETQHETKNNLSRLPHTHKKKSF